MAWKPDYVTAEELRNFVRTGAYDDTELALAATAASRAVDRHCNRQFGKVAAAVSWKYTARWDYDRCVWVIPIDDLMDITDLEFAIGGETVTTYTLEPPNAIDQGKVYTHVVIDPETETVVPTGAENEVTMTGHPGWDDVPDAAKLATRLQGSRFASRRESPHGIAGSPEAQVRLLSRLDPDVAVALADLVRPRSAR